MRLIFILGIVLLLLGAVDLILTLIRRLRDPCRKCQHLRRIDGDSEHHCRLRRDGFYCRPEVCNDFEKKGGDGNA